MCLYLYLKNLFSKKLRKKNLYQFTPTYNLKSAC